MPCMIINMLNWGSNVPQETLDAYGVKPGWVKIETLDKDGDGGVHKYGEDDRQILGHTNPDVILGLNNTFTYKKTLTFLSLQWHATGKP